MKITGDHVIAFTFGVGLIALAGLATSQIARSNCTTFKGVVSKGACAYRECRYELTDGRRITVYNNVKLEGDEVQWRICK